RHQPDRRHDAGAGADLRRGDRSADRRPGRAAAEGRAAAHPAVAPGAGGGAAHCRRPADPPGRALLGDAGGAAVIRRLLLAFCLLAGPAGAQEKPPETIVAGLSQNRVSITADFDGSEILVYGAVRRDSPPPEGRLDVI